MHLDDDLQDHPESLLERAIRDEISPGEQTELDRHLAECLGCAAELEAARILRSSMAPGAQDAALNHAAVELALSRIQDEALNQSAVDKALNRLSDRGGLGERLRHLLGSWRWLQPVGFAAMGAALALVVSFASLHIMRRTEPTVAQVPSSRSLMLEDGSEIAPFDGTTTIQLSEQNPTRTVVRLQSGSAQFRIRHNTQRLFRVDAGAFEIEDLGTLFHVEHQAEGKIRVTVKEGRVAVSHAASRLRVELGAGDDRVFSPAVALADTMEPPRVAPEPDPGPVKEASPVSASSTGARALPGSRGLDAPADLLLSADLARRSGQPQAAVAPLRRLLKRYPKDPRAPSAAFTLGWLLLTDLGRAREAAQAFAEAEHIAPRGALAEDAAARVAEAWQKAGDVRRAAEAARRYQQLYPQGRYAGLMRGMLDEK